MVSLYSIMVNHFEDYDTYDTTFDTTVTVCGFGEKDEQEDFYSKFTIGILRFVEVVSLHKAELVCDWSGMIERNIQVFKDFADKYWIISYPDDEEFIYQWIKEIDAWISGATTESMYGIFVTEYMPRLTEVN